MYNCYGCRTSFKLSLALVKHMGSGCPALVNSGEYHCGQESCFRHFTSASSLRKHLDRFHKSSDNSPLVNVIIPNQATSIGPVSVIDSDSVDISEESVCNTLTNRSIEHQLAIFLSSIYSKPGIPRSVVQSVAVELSNLMISTKEILLNAFRQSFYKMGVDLPSNGMEIIEDVLQQYVVSGSDLTSEYKRLQWFTNMGTYFPPVQVTIGERMEYVGFQLRPMPCTMQIIPIGDVLKKFLLMEGVLKDVLQNVQRLNQASNCDIENIMQGKVWKDILNKERGEHLNLPLILFYDDFEVGNPLGSHATVHKLGGVYVSLPFLPPFYVSQLNNIFILALFHASDRVTFGNKVIFQKMFDELNKLHNIGIHFACNAYTGIIKFHVACVTGDNLGLNGILGFVESFTSKYYCRICSAPKEQMQFMLFEEETFLRSTLSYERDLMLNNPSNTGIKERCAFLDSLEEFKLFCHVSVDLLHDFLEGVCRYVMSFVIQFLVQETKLVPYNILQLKLASFYYGADSSSSPANCLSIESGHIKLKTSAAEMLVLVRYFGLMVGRYVPRDCEVWDLYLYVRRILDRLINPSVNQDSSQQLKFWIAGLNELYCKLTRSTLKPKFHFLIHYPEMLLKFGPLTQVWTMRFEAKHRVSKIIARSSASRVNICKTIAVRYQLMLNDIFVQNRYYKKCTYGKQIIVGGNSEPYIAIDAKYNLNNINLYAVRWVKLGGCKIEISSIISVDLCTNTCLPLLARVKEVYITNDDRVFLFCEMFKVIDFELHYYAYIVNDSDDLVYLEASSILSCVTNTLSVMPDQTQYVTLRLPLD